MIRTSGKLTLAALTEITASPGPATGDGMSSTMRDSGAPYDLHRTAFIQPPAPSPQPLGGLARRHRNALPRNIARVLAAEERRQRRNVFGGRHPPQRRALDERLPHPLDLDAPHLGLPLDDAIDAVAGDGARRDRVDGDVVAPELEGEAVGHADLARLGRAVADPVHQPASSRHRGDVDDGAAA